MHLLIDSLPAGHRRDALNGVDAALERLAANPLLGSRGHLGRPTFHFRSPSGSTFCVTHVFRAAL